jgi:hypothetical protein
MFAHFLPILAHFLSIFSHFLSIFILFRSFLPIFAHFLPIFAYFRPFFLLKTAMARLDPESPFRWSDTGAFTPILGYFHMKTGVLGVILI